MLYQLAGIMAAEQRNGHVLDHHFILPQGFIQKSICTYLVKISDCQTVIRTFILNDVIPSENPADIFLNRPARFFLYDDHI